MAKNYAFCADLQIPFEAQHALPFFKAVVKEFKVPPENIYCVGDETDHYFGSAYQKDPNGWYTANSELAATRDKLRQWYKAFPLMKLAISNHGLRWAKKAFEAEIPSQMIKPYQELIEAPVGWVWKEEWLIKSKHPMRMIHGMGYSGAQAAVNAAIDSGQSCVIGHVHSHAGVTIIRRPGLSCWAMNTGCLIDDTQYAFTYNKYHRHRPCLGVGVVIDDGLTPIWVPYERFP